MTKCPVIFDCDGVLLDWEADFKAWVNLRYPEFKFTSISPTSWDLSTWIGCDKDTAFCLIQQFNQSEAFGRLPAMPYAALTLYYAKQMGHPIYVLTSCSSDPAVRRRREMNLSNLFSTKIERTICLDLGVSKQDTLQAFYTVFGPCIWVEDNFQNAMAGVEVGHHGFFLHRFHNQAYWGSEPQRLKHLEHLEDLVSLIK